MNGLSTESSTIVRGCTLLVLAMGLVPFQAEAQSSPAWPQWGQNPQHTGFLAVAGQELQGKLSDQIFDPFTKQEMAESAEGC